MKDGRGRRALQLEEVDSLSWAETELEWRPLREALGARIVGMAAFSAERAGQEQQEPGLRTALAQDPDLALLLDGPG